MNTKKIDMKNEVNRALRAKKRFLMLTGALMCMLFVSESAWAYSYYGALKVTASPDNQGVVYVAESTPITETIDEEEVVTGHTPAEVDYSAATAEYTGTSGDAGSGGNPVWMTAYAIPNQGYVFNGWSDLGGDGEPSLYNCTLSDNPIQVKIKSSTTDNGTNTATINANFIANPNPSWNVQYLTASNGTYAVKYESPGATQPTIGGAAVTTFDNDLITLTATPASGYAFYRFIGWDSDNNKYTIGVIGAPEQTVTIPDGTIKVSAEFSNHALLAGESTYPNLKDAIQALRKNDGTYAGVITLLQDYTVPAGYYTLPAGVTLLVPYKAGQTPQELIERTFNIDYVKPSQFRKLTLASGVHMDVFGTIEAGCKQSAKGQSNSANGAPTGPYGHVYMESGSDMTIESGAVLRAWGFVTGDGTIDVRRGGEVHEQFQILDFKGGSNTSNMCGGLSAMAAGTSSNEGDVFPLNQYFIQNVESKTTYHPGAKLFCSTAWYMSMSLAANDIQLVGVRNHKDGSADDVAMFLMDDEDDSDDTWIRKYYDNATDRQIFEVNNSAAIGSFVITMEGRIFPTANFDLPISNNMTIHLLYGNMDLTQDAVLLPGSEIILEKQSTFIVPEGVKLYLYDQAEWDKFVFSGFYAQRVKYIPSINGIPTVRINDKDSKGVACGLTSSKPVSAAITVKGSMQIDGAIYTTLGGANITSTNEDAGTILFNKNGAPTASGRVCQWNSGYVYSESPSAILRNEDPEHPTTTTAGTPAGQSYCYMNGKWTMMTVDEDNSCFVYDNYGNYYAKPGEYVMINATKTEGTFSGNTDHTYSDAEGTGRLFILMDDCQWWEVKNVDNLYHCIHPQNDTYYYWNDTNKKWEEKKFAISWKDYDGSPILDAQDNPAVYYLPYGATPKYLSTNPTRPADVDYTYNFIGWSPAFAPVTGDQAYTATYSKEQIKYTIIFKFVDSYRNGAEIERQQLARDEMPVIPTVKRDGWYLKWTPAVAAVTGNATYVADWMEELPDNYTVTWKNYDGTTLKTTTPARDASAATVLSGAPASPEKPATAEYRYEFTGWQPAVTSATADASYVAQYREVAQTYSIRFYQEDGTTQIDTTQSLVLGADPVVPNYSKSNTAQYTFRLQWKNMDTDVIVGVSVPSVSDSANYQAVIDTTINRYTITAVSEDENGVAIAGCTFTGAGTYDYGTNITLTAIPNEGYEFVKWQDTASNELDTTATMSVAITANRTYTAVVRSAAMEVAVDESKTFSRPTTITDLVINASEDGSSNLNGLENLTVTGNAYFNYHFAATRFDRRTQNWYAFGVPFEVDALTGISANGRQLVLGRDIDIVYYDGQKRADNGADNSAWTYVEDQSSKVLQPGVLYLAAFAANYDVVQFQFFKLNEEATLNNATAAVVKTYTSISNNNDGDANWNGIANPALYHAYLNAGTLDGQTYRSIDGSWQAADLSKDTFTIGRPVFVQVQYQQSVVVSRTAPSSAPLRRQAVAATSDRFDLQLLTPQNKTADRLFVIANEDAADTYTIGEDIAKAGVSTRVAQMWIDRYGARLCKNTIAATDNAALYPLTLTAPDAGSYTLQATAQSGDARLYLTYMGEVIADLSANNYTIDLVKGTNSGYGLRLVTTRRDVVTDLDEVLGPNSTSDNEAGTEQTQKCLYRNQLYLIRGGQVYDAQGQRVQ